MSPPIRVLTPAAHTARALHHPLRALALDVLQGQSWPLTVADVAWRLRLPDNRSTLRWLRRHLDELEQAGLVEVERAERYGRGHHNKYSAVRGVR